MEGRARTSAPPSSAALCPGCGKPVDVLRAGQVAIEGGAFRYFHDATCKLAYVETASKRLSLEAMTAEPPLVVGHAKDSGVRSAPVSPSVPPPPVEVPEAPSFPAPGSPRVAEEEAAPGPETPSASPPPVAPVASVAPPSASPPSPATLRSPDAPPSEPPPAEAPPPPRGISSPRTPARGTRRAGAPAHAEAAKGSLLALAPPLGITAGVLAVVVVLAGPSALALRVPLAVVAALLALASSWSRGARARPPGTQSGWLAAAPVATTLGVTLAVRVLAPLRTDVFAVLLAVASAAELVAELVLARARRDIDEARASAASALAIPAKVLRGERAEETPASEVKPGDAVVVEAGEVIPVDGVVAGGTAEVAPWLDSPILIEKREGDAVVAGAKVGSGSLRVTATFTAGDRAWLRMTQPGATTIEVAAPTLVMAGRLAAPVAGGAAALVGLLVFASNGSWPDVALVACASAMLIAARGGVEAVALAHARAHGAAQRRGVVYKDAAAFDRAGRADVAVVCSRGTVLLGEPEIVAVEAASGKGTSTDPEETTRVLALAAGAEIGSTHPFAAAVGRAARARGVRPESVRSAIGHSGLGVTALVASGERVVVGSRAFLLQEKISVAVADARISELEAQGRSVLLVAVAEKLVGLLALQDGLRPGARAAVQRLHDADIEPVLLSGEARETSESLARSLDIDHVRPEVLPSDRGAEVRALADNGHVVAAIGHPSTDDGALGAADVSVAMSAAGSSPGEWAISLASDDVRDAALALAIPRACRERSRTVLVVGLGAQAAMSLGVAFGVLPAAVIPVIGVCVVVVSSALVRDVTSSGG